MLRTLRALSREICAAAHIGHGAARSPGSLRNRTPHASLSASHEYVAAVRSPIVKAALSPNLYGTLDRIAATLNEYPKTSVAVVGYTDSLGSVDSNRDLSRRRATAVAEYLGQHGVAADRISVESRGEDNPIASNDSESGARSEPPR